MKITKHLDAIGLSHIKKIRMPEGLDTLGFANFTKLLDYIMPEKERRQSEIIISYIRIYTHLNTSFNLLNKQTCRRAIEYLSMTKKIIKNTSFREEKPYFRRLLRILNFVIRNKKSIISDIKKDETSDPYHVKTSVLLAQNICILRILKINKH
ncbi:hypothetical protein CMO83_05145 [Candidatus Woesearchaeota archaeon]|jgi:uncharacterized heparinase superfamily protein|nr:hypothetical protein [Candidatus Woesearchaeota archaeon]|tara:strand:- start:24149 stop:24607 length:459 start_codon:yes stop_codon:yes gene_type:complete